MSEEQMKYVANLISQDIEKDKEIERLHSIIKEVRKYIIQYGNLYCLKHTQFKNYHQYKVLLDILQGSDKE